MWVVWIVSALLIFVAGATAGVALEKRDTKVGVGKYRATEDSLKESRRDLTLAQQVVESQDTRLRSVGRRLKEAVALLHESIKDTEQ